MFDALLKRKYFYGINHNIEQDDAGNNTFEFVTWLVFSKDNNSLRRWINIDVENVKKRFKLLAKIKPTPWVRSVTSEQSTDMADGVLRILMSLDKRVQSLQTDDDKFLYISKVHVALLHQFVQFSNCLLYTSPSPRD